MKSLWSNAKTISPILLLFVLIIWFVSDVDNKRKKARPLTAYELHEQWRIVEQKTQYHVIVDGVEYFCQDVEHIAGRPLLIIMRRAGATYTIQAEKRIIIKEH